MNGYIYITGQGADPDANRALKDPMFRPVPSLGACMPNIRRAVDLDDWIFVVSGKTARYAQYIVGGMQVAEKISALEAFGRFPQNRLALDENGRLTGNVVVNQEGVKHQLDTHSHQGFDRRAQNFIVGKNAISLENEQEVARARAGTLGLLQEIAGKKGNRPIDVIGRMSKINTSGVDKVLNWIQNVKADVV